LFSDSTSPRGFIGGAQIGYNFQTGAYVYGVEADWQFSAQKGSSSLLCPGVLCGAASVTGITLDHTEKLTSFGTLRGRIGYAFDRWMIYGTGGLAFGTIKSDLTATTALGSVAFSNSTTRTGWTLGAGVENALVGNWSWKLEYLYMDFGTFTITNALGLPVVLAGTTINQTVKFTDQIIRVGVNYRF
jgi:outer membrane immunogenic protein